MFGWLGEQEEKRIDSQMAAGLELAQYMETNTSLKGDSVKVEDSIRQMQKFTQNLEQIEKGGKLELLVDSKVMTLTRCKSGNIRVNQ